MLIISLSIQDINIAIHVSWRKIKQQYSIPLQQKRSC